MSECVRVCVFCMRVRSYASLCVCLTFLCIYVHVYAFLNFGACVYMGEFTFWCIHARMNVCFLCVCVYVLCMYVCKCVCACVRVFCVDEKDEKNA